MEGRTPGDPQSRDGKAGAQDIIISTDRAAGLVTLSRPAAHNALNTAMRSAMAAAFPRWARDPAIYGVVISSASERAFCAGGDVRELIEWGRNRRDDAIRSLAQEYALNWQLDCFAKPTVSLINGVVMGSGVGISLFGTHRVAGENYRFSMPETSIGLFPDVGVAWAFARLPDEIGTYLALTGRAIGRADAYRLGLATHCVPAARFGEVAAGLADDDDEGSTKTATCTGSVTTSCVCKMTETKTEPPETKSGTWSTTADGTLTMTDTGETPETNQYCVKGNEVKVKTPDGILFILTKQ